MIGSHVILPAPEGKTYRLHVTPYAAQLTFPPGLLHRTPQDYGVVTTLQLSRDEAFQLLDALNDCLIKTPASRKEEMTSLLVSGGLFSGKL